MSHPDGLPDLFIDRSLGRKQVPALLRAAGLRLVTLAEHYGIPVDQNVTDEDWLQLAGEQGWAVFTKDARIRYKRAEKEAISKYRVRCFCLRGKNLRAEGLAQRFLDNLARIVKACESPGPLIYAVHKDRIEKLDIGGLRSGMDNQDNG